VKYAFGKAEVNARIGRWVVTLSEYDFKIIHKKNDNLRHADSFSRNPTSEIQSVFATIISEEDWLLAAQQGDADIRKIRETLETGEYDENKELFENYALKGGKVYKITPNGLRWVVPQLGRYQLLRWAHDAHDETGHFAFDKTYELISSQYWFKGMRRFIKKYIKNCLDCLFFKSPAGKLPGELHPIPKVPRPFHTVHVDHLGPFVKTKKGNTYVFVAIDAFTKFILLYAVRNTKTNLVTKSLLAFRTA
jgi:hypothetical protein